MMIALFGIHQFGFAQQRGTISSYEYKGNKKKDAITSEFKKRLFEKTNDKELTDLFYGWATVFYIKPQYDLDLYSVKYNTLDHNNQPYVASGLVAIPRKAKGLPITAYCHGTVFKKEDVPSFLSGAGDGFEIYYTYLMASDGHIMVAPDYQGMGSGRGFHPYVEAVSEGNATLDLMRAAKQLVKEKAIGTHWDNTSYLTGYSQGGHAAVSALKMIHDKGLENEFNVQFVGAGGTPADLSDSQFHYIVNNPLYPTRQYILYVIATASFCSPNQFDSIDKILKPKYVPLYKKHILKQTGKLDWVPEDWNTMFLPGVIDQMKPYNSPLRKFLRGSDVYNFTNQVPTRFYASTEDEQVTNKCSTLAEGVMRGRLPWWERGKIKADLFSNLVSNDHSTTSIFSVLYWTERIRNYKNGIGNNARESRNQTMFDIDKNLNNGLTAKSYFILKSKQNIASVTYFNIDGEKVTEASAQKLNDKTYFSTYMLNSGIYKAQLNFENGKTKQVPLMVEKPKAILMEGIIVKNEKVVLPTRLLPMHKAIGVVLYDNKGTILKEMPLGNTISDLVFNTSLFENEKSYLLEIDFGTEKQLFKLPLATLKLQGAQSVLPSFNKVGRVYPNPLTPESSVTITSTTSKEVEIKQFDITGRLLSNKIISVEKGVNTIVLDFIFKQGNTFLVINSDEGIETRKLLVSKN